VHASIGAASARAIWVVSRSAEAQAHAARFHGMCGLTFSISFVFALELSQGTEHISVAARTLR
jgi:hypothetical protein